MLACTSSSPNPPPFSPGTGMLGLLKVGVGISGPECDTDLRANVPGSPRGCPRAHGRPIAYNVSKAPFSQMYSL